MYDTFEGMIRDTTTFKKLRRIQYIHQSGPSSPPGEGRVCGPGGCLQKLGFLGHQLGDVRFKRERRQVHLGEDEVRRLVRQHDVVASRQGTAPPPQRSARHSSSI